MKCNLVNSVLATVKLQVTFKVAKPRGPCPKGQVACPLGQGPGRSPVTPLSRGEVLASFKLQVACKFKFARSWAEPSNSNLKSRGEVLASFKLQVACKFKFARSLSLRTSNSGQSPEVLGRAQ
jgi:hypothetical protein